MKYPQSKILDHDVHPAAMKLPLLDGEAFEKLKNQIREMKTHANPIVRSGSVILSGLNEATAIEQLQNENLTIEPRFKEWQPADDEETEAVFAVRAYVPLRQENDEQRVVVVRDAYPEIQKEAQQRQEATRIKPGEVHNPAGRRGKQEMVATPDVPPSPEEKLKRSREKTANSTDGQIAKLADVSVAIVRKVNKAVKHGGLEAREKILAGTANAKDFLPPKAKQEPPGADNRVELRRCLRGELDRIHKKYPAAPEDVIRDELLGILGAERGACGEGGKAGASEDAPENIYVSVPAAHFYDLSETSTNESGSLGGAA